MPKYERIFVLNNPIAPRLCPELAVEIGLNESILLLQLEFWISIGNKKKKERDGRIWTYQSLAEIQQTFCFWSLSTINRAIRNLEERKLIFVANYNATSYDRTRWFALNAEEINKLKSIKMAEAAICQNDKSNVSNWQIEDSNLANRSSQTDTTIPETTTETTTETTQNSRGGRAPHLLPRTEPQRLYCLAFRRKRFNTEAQMALLDEIVAKHGMDIFRASLKWAAESGITNIRSMASTAKRMAEEGVSEYKPRGKEAANGETASRRTKSTKYSDAKRGAY